MSSGWPPEDDGNRWEPVRHVSAVGAVHDSRAAERGHSGYARYTSDAGGSGAFGPYYLPPSYDETDWYGAQGEPGPADASHPSGPLPGTHGGHGATGPGELYGAPFYTEAGYSDTGAGNGQYEAGDGAYQARDGQYGADGDGSYGSYGDGTYEEAPYGGAAYGQGHPGEQYAPEQYQYALDQDTEPYAPGQYTEPYAPGQYTEPYAEGGYPEDAYEGHEAGGHGQRGYPDPPEHQGSQPAAPTGQDYSYQDYGDPRYDDPSYGDLAYDDPQRAAAGYAGTSQAESSYSGDGDQDAGYGGHGHGGYQDAEVQDAGGYYGPGPGYGAPEYGAYGPGGGPGYVSSEYVSGQYPAGAVAIDELSVGLPDPAATGMLEATGMLDSTGISDHVELYDYHPGAAEASRGFLDGPAPTGTLGMTGVDPSGFAGGPAAAGDHGTVLTGAEAADGTGVLEGGSGFFDHVDPADTSIDLPAARLGRGPKTGGTGALLRPRPGSRPAGRRRGRSGDRRLWFALAGVVVVFAGALAAIFTLAFPSGPGGPDHTLITPDKLNAFVRRPALEQQMNVGQLRQDVVNMSSGQARNVVEAVYEAGNSTSGTTPQIVLFIGGNLLNVSPKVSVTSFTQRFKGAGITSAGSLGGEAACVNATASEPGSVAMCAWFDNDSFGEVVSPTMNASALANTMRQIRPHVELVVRQKQ